METDFAIAEQFRIKGHVFELAHIGKRSMALRIVKAEKPEPAGFPKRTKKVTLKQNEAVDTI